jgi:hypothetical protein
MVHMNMHTGIMMARNKFGIFRSVNIVHKGEKTPIQIDSEMPENISDDSRRSIRNWNNTIGQYVVFSEDANLDHELINIRGENIQESSESEAEPVRKIPKSERKVVKSYVHITSPIRRLVDLLNQMLMYQYLPGLVNNMTPESLTFLKDWLGKLDYINDLMKSIRKIQSDCELLSRTTNNPEILLERHSGVLFNKVVMNNGMISYMVYLEKLKLISRIATRVDVPIYTVVPFKIYMFEDEDKVKKKIRLQILDITTDESCKN